MAKLWVSRLFYCLKNWLDFYINIWSGEQVLLWTLFDSFNFWTPLFCKNGANFWQLGITPFQKTFKLLLNLVSYVEFVPFFILRFLVKVTKNEKVSCPVCLFFCTKNRHFACNFFVFGHIVQKTKTKKMEWTRHSNYIISNFVLILYTKYGYFTTEAMLIFIVNMDIK